MIVLFTSIICSFLMYHLSKWIKEEKDTDCLAGILGFVIGVVLGLIISGEIARSVPQEIYKTNWQKIYPLTRSFPDENRYYVRQIADGEKVLNEYHLDRISDATFVDNRDVPVKEGEAQIGKLITYSHRPVSLLARIFCYNLEIVTAEDTREIIVPYKSILRDKL